MKRAIALVGLCAACGGGRGGARSDASPPPADAAPPSWRSVVAAHAGGESFELRTTAVVQPGGVGRCSFARASYAAEGLLAKGQTIVETWPAEQVAFVIDGGSVDVPVVAVVVDAPPLEERHYHSSDTDAPEPARKLLAEIGEVVGMRDCLAPDTAYRAQVREVAGGHQLWVTGVGGAAETFELAEDGTHATASGQRWTFTHASHKHPAEGGRAHGFWSLTVERDGQKLEISVSGEALRAEGVAFGQRYQLEAGEQGRVRVKLAADAHRPLTREAAAALARQRYDADGHPTPTSWSSWEHDGTFAFSYGPTADGNSLRVVVGRHSGQLLLVEPVSRARGRGR